MLVQNGGKLEFGHNIERGSGSQGESLEDLEKPQRIAQIKSDYEARKMREKKKLGKNGQWPQLEKSGMMRRRIRIVGGKKKVWAELWAPKTRRPQK